MIAANATSRQRYTLYLAALATTLWLGLALTTVFAERPDDTHARMGVPLLADFEARKGAVATVRLRLADDSYTLERQTSGWTLVEAANYPVRDDRINALFDGLATLSYAETRTADPTKHDLLGLAAPEAGGSGAEIQILDAEANPLGTFIAGRRNDQLYVRLPDEDQTYRAGGTLPPFYNRRAWLDFDIISVEPSTIRAVRLRDSRGDQLYLNREVGNSAQAFRPAPPDQDATLISRLGVSTTALALARFAPRSAKPADTLKTDPVGTHITETYDGLEIALTAYRETDGTWVTLRAIEAGEGARRATDINRKTHDWAFELSRFDFDDFTPEISSLVTRPEQNIAEP